MKRPTRVPVVLLALLALSAAPGTAQTGLDAAAPTALDAAASLDLAFAVNEREAVGGVRVESSLERVPVDVAHVQEAFDESGMTVVFLLDEAGDPVALDVAAPGVKETLLFNAENTAKANVVFAMSVIGVPPALQLAAYDRVPEHPRFAELAALYREAGRHLSTRQAMDLALQIGVETARRVRKEEVYGLGG